MRRSADAHPVDSPAISGTADHSMPSNVKQEFGQSGRFGKRSLEQSLARIPALSLRCGPLESVQMKQRAAAIRVFASCICRNAGARIADASGCPSAAVRTSRNRQSSPALIEQQLRWRAIGDTPRRRQGRL